MWSNLKFSSEDPEATAVLQLLLPGKPWVPGAATAEGFWAFRHIMDFHCAWDDAT